MLSVHPIKQVDIIRSFGDGESNLRADHASWAIFGDIRKIGIKTRLWDDRQVIQGFKVELIDGTKKAVGMELDDMSNVSSFNLDPDDHIVYPFTLRSGWYIDKIGFHTKKGKVLGPVGGDGGDIRRQPHNISECHYLWGILGRTVVTQGAPCIYMLEFKVISLSS